MFKVVAGETGGADTIAYGVVNFWGLKDISTPLICICTGAAIGLFCTKD